MKRLIILGLIFACFATLCLGQRSTTSRSSSTRSTRFRTSQQKIIQLTEPNLTGTMSFEEALAKRGSISQLSSQALKRTQIGQLAWAGQGITDPQNRLRTAPSAGAAYPMELYFVTQEGIYIYLPSEHSLEQTLEEDVRNMMATATAESSIAPAGCDIIIAGSVRKLTTQFRNKAKTFMLLEAGHIAQNIQLQAVCLGLGSVTIGSFDVANVRKICRMSRDLEPLYIIRVGYPVSTTAVGTTSDQAGPTGKRAALIVASQNFRDEELFETKRALDSVGVETVIASTRLGTIRGMLGNVAEAGILLGQLNPDDYDAVIFVGGSGAVEYFANPYALNIAREAVRKRKVVAAISIAPTVLANAGVLTGIRATSFLSEQGRLVQAGAIYTGIPVEQDRLIITASGPGASIQFGRVVADALAGR